METMKFVKVSFTSVDQDGEYKSTLTVENDIMCASCWATRPPESKKFHVTAEAPWVLKPGQCCAVCQATTTPAPIPVGVTVLTIEDLLACLEGSDSLKPPTN